MYTTHTSFRSQDFLGVCRRVWHSSPELPRSCWTFLKIAKPTIMSIKYISPLGFVNRMVCFIQSSLKCNNSLDRLS